jgi:hypothetical protein
MEEKAIIFFVLAIDLQLLRISMFSFKPLYFSAQMKSISILLSTFRSINHSKLIILIWKMNI